VRLATSLNGNMRAFRTFTHPTTTSALSCYRAQKNRRFFSPTLVSISRDIEGGPEPQLIQFKLVRTESDDWNESIGFYRVFAEIAQKVRYSPR